MRIYRESMVEKRWVKANDRIVSVIDKVPDSFAELSQVKERSKVLIYKFLFYKENQSVQVERERSKSVFFFDHFKFSFSFLFFPILI